MSRGSATCDRANVYRPIVAAVVVLAVYAGFALSNSTLGYLGTDTGAKVITLDTMVEQDTARPAVGYWAERWDPDGEYHPLFDTKQNDEDEWINVTTLPMLLAAKPLYEVGGYRLALALPMLGALLAAFACRTSHVSSPDRGGWAAFWVVALASPVAIYALDFWEHALGAGLMLSAVSMLLRIERGAPPGCPLARRPRLRNIGDHACGDLRRGVRRRRRDLRGPRVPTPDCSLSHGRGSRGRVLRRSMAGERCARVGTGRQLPRLAGRR